MKVLGNLPIIKDVNSVYPFGAAIKNQTETEQGTPAIREIYNDVLMNIYKILQLTGVNPSNKEDNNYNGYQIIEALKKLPNSLNDIEQILTLDGTVWTVPFDLQYLPNKYMFVARASEDYNPTITYTFKGLGVTELPFNNINGFSATDELLVIIDTSGVRSYSLNKPTEASSIVYTGTGQVVTFNDLNTVYYYNNNFSSGWLVADTPNSCDILNIVRLFASKGTLEIKDIFIHNNTIVCFCFDPSDSTYFIYDVDLTKLTVSFNIELSNDADSYYDPVAYMDENGDLWMTNRGNLNGGVNNNEVYKFVRNGLGIFTFNSTITLDVSFVKTRNAAIKHGFLYTHFELYLNKYNLTTGALTSSVYFPAIGQLMQLNGEVYFNSGYIAKRFDL
ncbi:hypothetical protein [Flavobacterium phage FCOV-F14]|uniref:Uncharacterized protein n=7 Tax=Ficleduovirus FCL2 TaxID=2560473 RepID=A0A7G8L426_9CAUD|nr:hypothetical protein [Flavobacterium phage FCOV-F13]QCW21219.1 hypothetical protein [Flavobacterium phage FCOV-F16]QCW21521.1 hypothetical protein [Flavobacterium phage FCOV-F45]QCW21595.1 hypothetical protein [Flavobacterium phage FCOV-F46]QCW21669.1 hypothetical protein [Flavobacterium phage FCOV-F54]QNJ51691.1 hypothetical protein [Flavobacterium phage FCOV-F14]QNJ51765.1 hypothetical protein [Flavobacterium phage FCOV-F15]